MLPRLSPVEFQLLAACREATGRAKEMLPLVAQAIGVAQGEAFYTWALHRCKPRWTLEGTNWNFVFHGLECDLENTADGRLLRLDFGPGGRVDTFTMWGVLRFVMTSNAPWPEYSDLKREFAESGTWTNTTAIEAVWDRLDELGMFQEANEELAEFEENYASIGPDGLRHVNYPPGTPETVQADCAVAHRLVLTESAHRVLSAGAGSRTG
jgi:hypothetical protein